MRNRRLIILILLFLAVNHVQGQLAGSHGNLEIKLNQGETRVETTETGALMVQVSTKDLARFKQRGYILYSDLGAKGDGKADDIDAIAATHALANQEGLTVKADPAFTYYISGKARTAVIRTDTDFGSAKFILDDTQVENRKMHVFLVASDLRPFVPEGLLSLQKNQKKIDIPLPGPSLITVTNSAVRRYIRFGPNQNQGHAQTDIFMVDQNGHVDPNAPIIWDFDQITDVTAIPLDEAPLTIKGGTFTTIANQEESKYNYYARGIGIRRSNVLLEGLEHRVTGEGDHGAPYGGFLNFSDCANVTIRNTVLTGHKTYQTIGSAGVTVSMGTYDISINRAINIRFEHCSQTNDINDPVYWGIMGSNFCKNLVLDHCSFSRFDAHMGVANATIRNSTLGHMGINAIGTGTFLVENSTINGRNLINLRSDYGSTWQGEFIIRNCTFIPLGGRTARPILIGASNAGQHDFGYTTYMPERIVIENLHIADSNHPVNYQGPVIFSNFNPRIKDDSYHEKYPYVRSKEVFLKNITTESGMELRVSDNPHLFKELKVVALSDD
ncbi:MAG: hypothetical protein FWJ85_03225 [Solitalea sp.]